MVNVFLYFSTKITIQNTKQNLKGTRYRLKIVVTELDATNISIEYQVALLSFINCLINATQGLRDRMRIRNEFIGKFDYFFWFFGHNNQSENIVMN